MGGPGGIVRVKRFWWVFRGICMSFEEFMALTGLEALLADGFFTTQLGILMITGLLFLASFAFCLLAMKSAGSARRMRREATALFEDMQSLAGEMRSMKESVSDPSSYRGVRVGSREMTPEADVEIRHRREPRRRDETLELREEDRDLAAARRAAIEPSALLRRGFLRRR
jgi:hypothetical protein